uniref:Uncharacterized protein n=1 Tax=Cacopsylla melanoneura TaxID=428564 RepID=A0A8D9B9B0_9HEMI
MRLDPSHQHAGSIATLFIALYNKPKNPRAETEPSPSTVNMGDKTLFAPKYLESLFTYFTIFGLHCLKLLLVFALHVFNLQRTHPLLGGLSLISDNLGSLRVVQ